MVEKPMCEGQDCPECQKREQEHKQKEEMGLAVLISLVPMLTLTVFNMMGLFN